ncbi:protein-L-isoaspartate O-methyltransferase family protein [Histidinibacterium lentulum]|uniref:Protein-L-isoaspartate O-methyltransferase n=1 Tax=Histidinibacterium lentulum TaxID=2480588 RepID=A0A3N2QV56_9RHOB|nr:protein-L-isoaspartate O-methyltransferase [Histidinibacterium lentulum]ROT99128.1 protein-L-isoaspartate O-methyltransferase [Histidinibacterium lentulum]
MADYDKRRTAMVDTQVRPSDVTKFPIIQAMLTVPRELFVPDDLREAAYVGENLDLGGGRVLLEPRTFAKMLDGLDVGPSDLVLDVGCGYGYSTAVLSRLADFVVGVEDDADRAAEAQGLLSERGIDNAGIVEGPLAEGWRDSAPYDVILLEGGAETVPATLTDQLKEGGRIAAVFMEGGLGTVRIGYNIDGSVTWRYAFNAAAPVLAGFERQETFAF